VGPVDDGAVFLSESGERLAAESLTGRVRELLDEAGFKGRGSCHLLRHACATALLEGGADVRFVQELLGHANLETTEVYTHVTITKLKAVYSACHPAAREEDVSGEGGAGAGADAVAVTAEQVLEQLDAEDEE
jgi:integrase/recombinase XerD